MPYPKKSAENRAVARDKSRQAKWKRIRFRDNRLPETKHTYMGDGCWCGEQVGHDWPGKSEGALHPNPREVHDLTPKQQERAMQTALQEAGVCPRCRGYPAPDARSDMEKQLGILPKRSCPPCLGTGVFPPPNYEEAKRIMKEREPEKSAEERLQLISLLWARRTSQGKKFMAHSMDVPTMRDLLDGYTHPDEVADDD